MQKSDKLWEKIYADFRENWEMVPNESRPEPRSQTAASSRFTKLKPTFKAWGAALAYARRNLQSGSNLQDERRKAQSWYVAKMKKEFTRFECWEVVKNHPTFREVSTSTPPFSYSDTASTPLVSPMPPTFDVDEDEGIPTPQSNLEGSSSPVRPIGVKAAKEAKRKGKKVMTSSNEARDEALKSIAENQKSL
ncbi:hypothetical protein ACLB2K_060659 [Fragaria x ananassa]